MVIRHDLGDLDDGFGHYAQSMGNYMKDLGWMEHKDYDVQNMGEEDICLGR